MANIRRSGTPENGHAVVGPDRQPGAFLDVFVGGTEQKGLVLPASVEHDRVGRSPLRREEQEGKNSDGPHDPARRKEVDRARPGPVTILCRDPDPQGIVAVVMEGNVEGLGHPRHRQLLGQARQGNMAFQPTGIDHERFLADILQGHGDVDMARIKRNVA